MHKLNLFTGGHTRSLNDLQQLQSQTVDVVKALSLVYSDDPVNHKVFILSGLRQTVIITNLRWEFSEGWIFIDDEVWHIPTFRADADDLDSGVFFRKTYSNGVNNPVTYKDASTHAVHVEGTLTPFSTYSSSTQLPYMTTVAGDIPFAGMKRAEEYFALKARASLRTAWTALTLSGTISGTLYWMKCGLTNMGFLNGLLTVNSPTSLPDPPVYVTPVALPSDIRPAAQHTFNAQVRYNGGAIGGAGSISAILNLHCEVIPGSGNLNIGVVKSPTSLYQFRISTGYVLD